MPGTRRRPLRRGALAVWLALCCALVAGPARAAPPPIVEIRFVGNDITREIILRQEMVVSEGDLADPERIETSRQNIMNLGLFKAVKARLLPAEGGRILEIEVKEKFYILPLPTLDRNAEGDISWGGELRIDNLLGYNQQLVIKNESTDRQDAGVERENSVSYAIARIPGTRFGLEAAYEFSTDVETAEGPGQELTDYDRETRKASLGLSRWLRRDAPSRGWRASLGLAWTHSRYAARSGAPPPPEDGRDVRLNLGLEYTALEEYAYNRGGKEYGLELAVGARSLGSDEDYQRLRLYRREYLRLSEREPYNLNYQLQAGYARNTDPGDAFFTLGSSDSLRGYERDSIRGDAYLQANVEYIAPLLGHRRLRGVVFADVGNAYADGRIDPFDLKTALGLGLRWKIPAFVKLDLRIDAAYALDEGDYKVYAGSSHAF